jgi:protein-L-isoaspartate(D-aspartate) O-methyltransferase
MASNNDPADDDRVAERERMLDAIDAEVAHTARETGCARLDDAVRAALAAVPRHRFVPPPWRDLAYENRPLPIGHGQTISQPFIVALMTQLLALRPGDRVLEVGTGCGHQAAVLARLAAHVTSVEIVPALELRARQTLAALDVANVELHVGDGQAGWPPGAPYDAVIATAAAESVPPAWLEQLAPGGRLVAPIGERHGAQYLQLWRKDAAGDITRQRSLAVRFVPLVDAAP